MKHKRSEDEEDSDDEVWKRLSQTKFTPEQSSKAKKILETKSKYFSSSKKTEDTNKSSQKENHVANAQQIPDATSCEDAEIKPVKKSVLVLKKKTTSSAASSSSASSSSAASDSKSTTPTSVTKQSEEGFDVCFICSDSLAALTSEQRAEHVNMCLDRTAQTEYEKRNPVKPVAPSVITCMICNKDLTHFSVQKREQHVNRCCEKSKTETVDDYVCIICQKSISNLAVRGRIKHIKLCAKLNNVTPAEMKKLLDDDKQKNSKKTSTAKTRKSKNTSGAKRKRSEQNSEPEETAKDPKASAVIPFFEEYKFDPSAKLYSRDGLSLSISEKYDTVAEWLTTLGLQEYTSAFMDAGFDTLDVCVEITEDELKETMKIKKPGHVKRLSMACKQLKKYLLQRENLRKAEQAKALTKSKQSKQDRSKPSITAVSSTSGSSKESSPETVLVSKQARMQEVDEIPFVPAPLDPPIEQDIIEETNELSDAAFKTPTIQRTNRKSHMDVAHEFLQQLNVTQPTEEAQTQPLQTSKFKESSGLWKMSKATASQHISLDVLNVENKQEVPQDKLGVNSVEVPSIVPSSPKPPSPVKQLDMLSTQVNASEDSYNDSFHLILDDRFEDIEEEKPLEAMDEICQLDIKTLNITDDYTNACMQAVVDFRQRAIDLFEELKRSVQEYKQEAITKMIEQHKTEAELAACLIEEKFTLQHMCELLSREAVSKHVETGGAFVPSRKSKKLSLPKTVYSSDEDQEPAEATRGNAETSSSQPPSMLSQSSQQPQASQNTGVLTQQCMEKEETQDILLTQFNASQNSATENGWALEDDGYRTQNSDDTPVRPAKKKKRTQDPKAVAPRSPVLFSQDPSDSEDSLPSVSGPDSSEEEQPVRAQKGKQKKITKAKPKQPAPAKSKEKQPSKKVSSTQDKSNMPDFASMPAEQLKERLAKYGVKSGSKQFMIDKLTQIWKAMN